MGDPQMHNKISIMILCRKYKYRKYMYRKYRELVMCSKYKPIPLADDKDLSAIIHHYCNIFTVHFKNNLMLYR
jgi:hypothetical protein